MIPAEQLEKLKRLFAEDGITLNDAQALEIGHWLVATVGPILKPVPLDKMADLATIKSEVDAVRRAVPFANLYDWRRKKAGNNAS